MDTYDFLRKFQQMQYGVSYSELVDLGFATLAYSEKDTSIYDNYALTNQVLSDEQLKIIEDYYNNRDRMPLVYFDSSEKYENLRNYLTSKGYEKKIEDCYLFFEGEVIDKSRFSSVKKVETEDELEVFLTTLDKTHEEGDPQNPYGSISSFLESGRHTWKKYRASNQVQYYMAFKDDKPVSTAILNCSNGMGYIYGVGSLRSVRGEGFGKLITLYSVQASMDFGNTEHFLGTEKGHFPYEFYTRIGFKHRHTSVGYGKTT